MAKESVMLVPLAEKLIAVCLSDLGHCRDYEKGLELATIGTPKLEIELRQTIWQLYSEWVKAAEQVFDQCAVSPAAGALW